MSLVARFFGKMAASIGTKISEIETPALLVDLDRLERNLRRMSASLADVPIAVRPHAKAHKCPAIGRMQVGAVLTVVEVASISKSV